MPIHSAKHEACICIYRGKKVNTSDLNTEYIAWYNVSFPNSHKTYIHKTKPKTFRYVTELCSFSLHYPLLKCHDVRMLSSYIDVYFVWKCCVKLQWRWNCSLPRISAWTRYKLLITFYFLIFMGFLFAKVLTIHLWWQPHLFASREWDLIHRWNENTHARASAHTHTRGIQGETV